MHMLAVKIIFSAVTLGFTLYFLNKEWNERQRNQTYHSTYSGQNQQICCICLDDLNTKLTKSLPCRHKFHKNCIASVFENQAIRSCPNCRTLVPRDYTL